MGWRLHRGGRFRAWLGAKAGGDARVGDRIWRRGLHLLGAGVLIYEFIPTNFFIVLPKFDVLVLALVAVLALEVLRLQTGLELPTIRPYEAQRVASFAWYAIALTLAVLVFPPPIAGAAVLGVAIVDPMIGELRQNEKLARFYPLAPVGLYAVLAASALTLGGWSLARIAVGAPIAAVIGVAVERPKIGMADDDLAMTLVPAIALLGVAAALPTL